MSHSSPFSHGEHLFRADDQTFGYTIRGHGPLIVVQCPGWGIGPRYLIKSLHPLRKQFTLLHFEPRGTGRSSRPEDETKMSTLDMAEDLESLRLHLGLEQLSILGPSKGGCIALSYAEMFPERVNRLVVVSHHLLGFEELSHGLYPGIETGHPLYKQASKRLTDLKPTSDEMFGQYMREFLPSYFYDPVKSMPPVMEVMNENPSVWCLSHNIASDENAGTRQMDDLPKVSAKTLIIFGKEDLIYSVKVGEATKNGIGENARLVVFDECGHFPWIEKSSEFFELVTRFMYDLELEDPEEEAESGLDTALPLRGGDRPIGPEISRTIADRPSHMVIDGQYITLEPLSLDHAADLYAAVGGSEHGWLWDYMPDGPFLDPHTFQEFILQKSLSNDPLFFSVLDASERTAIGFATLMRIDPTNRVIEVGNIMFSPILQRSTAATECMYLLARTVFDRLGYRRYEWKCNNLNAPSKRAAERLGFSFEGVFRQHMIVKGRNRDTAWYSLLDSEWPVIKKAFELWLSPENFDEEGNQKYRLQDLRNAV